MKIASSKPITMQATMKHAPQITLFCSDTSHRSLWKSRAYCANPTKSFDGNVCELLRDTRAVQTIVPRYANTTVRIIGSRASQTAIENRRFSGLRCGVLPELRRDFDAAAAGTLSACIAAP